jgi:hypothetical protein
MKTKLIVAAAIVAFAAMTAQAQDPATQAEIVSPESQVLKRRSIDWDDPQWWEAMQKKENTVQIGRSDFSIEGPIVRSFRRPRNWSQMSLADKITSLPIVGLFVPQPMYVEHRRLKDLRRSDYLRWGESDQPWSNIGDRPIGGAGLIGVSY